MCRATLAGHNCRLYSVNSVVEHCAYEDIRVRIAMVGSSNLSWRILFGRCRMHRLLGNSLVNKRSLLFTTFQGDESVWRSNLRDIHTYTRGTAIAHNTHTSRCYGRMVANRSYRSCTSQMPTASATSLGYVLPTPMLHGVLADSW
jgi:hypothetical protein